MTVENIVFFPLRSSEKIQVIPIEICEGRVETGALRCGVDNGLKQKKKKTAGPSLSTNEGLAV